MTRPDQTRPDQTIDCALYSETFYVANSSDQNYISARKVIELTKTYLTFDSVFDVGCGVGQILKVCLDLGVKTVRGVDGSWLKDDMLVIPHDRFTACDISQPDLKNKIPEKQFDLTVSSEVAEHIEPQYADIFMDNLTSFSDVVLFSAAIPGQGGTNHVNEQWPSYWIEKFNARGFIAIDCIRPIIWYDKTIRRDYRQNMFMLVREDALKNYPALERVSDRTVIDAAHHEVWDMKIRSNNNAINIRNMGFKSVCKSIILGFVYLIPSFIRAVKRRLA